MERACAGVGGVVLLTGEPGIGKSRFAEQLAAWALELGAKVAVGRCWEAGGAPAYWPWIEVFRELEMDEDPFSGAAADLAAVAPEARFAVFERAVRALRARAAERPLVLVLDDLHAADAPSLLLSRLVAREAARAPLLLVGAYRDAELELKPGIAPLLAALARDAQVLALRRLAPEAVSAWLADALPGAGPERAAELFRLTEGQPLFVHEALRLAGADKRHPFSLGWGGVLDERLGQLAAPTRSLLAAAAVLGRDFERADLAAISGEDPDRVHAALREALAASILVTGRAPGALRFSHVLLRDRLYAELAPSARATLHARAGAALLARGAGEQAAVHHLFEGQSALDQARDAGEPGAVHGSSEGRSAGASGGGAGGQRAVHRSSAGESPLDQARDAGEPTAGRRISEGQSALVRVAEVAERAAAAALAQLAFEQAAEIGLRALSLPGASELPSALSCELELRVAEAQLRLGDSAAAIPRCVRAAARAEQGGHAELLARAALVYGTELASGTVDAQMVMLLRNAEAALGRGDSALRVRVLARLAAALTPLEHASDHTEVPALVRESLSMARRLGDRHALLYALQFAATVGMLVPEQERFAVLEETVGLARALGQRLVLAHSLPVYLAGLLERGERAQAEAVLGEYRELASELRQPRARVTYLLVNGLMLSLQGDFAGADRAAEEATQVAREAGLQSSLFTVLTYRLSQAQLRADPQLLASEAPAVLALLSRLPGAGPHVAWFLAGIGRVEEARERLRLYTPDLQQHRALNLWELSGAGEASVLLGDRALARQIYPLLLRAADRMFWNMAPGALIGPIARVLGDLAQLLGQMADARRHYDEAIAFCEKLQAARLVELCRAARQRAEGVPASHAQPAQSAPDSASAAPASAAANSGKGNLLAVLQLRREGEVWTLSSAAGGGVRLKHGKGVQYLQYLLERPGTEVHVLALAGIDQRAGDAGPALDAQAKQSYRQRLDALRDELAEAERFGDGARAERAQAEVEAISEQLAKAVGLGGRDRRAASDVERTRINVQRRLKDVIERVAAADPALGRYLAAAIKTGTTCVYQPL
jgi:hypothetical protein